MPRGSDALQNFAFLRIIEQAFILSQSRVTRDEFKCARRKRTTEIFYCRSHICGNTLCVKLRAFPENTHALFIRDQII